MADENDDRDQGIQFGDLEDELEAIDYPITNEELIERFGDRTLETADQEVRLDDVLAEQSDTTYESPSDVHDGVLNMVGDEALGREGYSDRGPAEQDEEQESF